MRTAAGRLTDASGKPIAGAVLDVCSTSSSLRPSRRASRLGELGETLEVGEELGVALVAEGVVVVLEAVEVEQHEDERAAVVGPGQHVLERAGQRALVAESGQRVGQSSTREVLRIETLSRKVSTSRAITATSASAESPTASGLRSARQP